ncbi:hypothetical protein EYF80_037549 [Liparis tanakae]|uniref:Uncharacterized protein n=1 Tax=Liparis tanakae TaxID=230148 RepID=A0A4Z2GGI1_9TELE|nr:hypothetical protein EYF80_037549 [Liparis tanakae]
MQEVLEPYRCRLGRDHKSPAFLFLSPAFRRRFKSPAFLFQSPAFRCRFRSLMSHSPVFRIQSLIVQSRFPVSSPVQPRFPVSSPVQPQFPVSSPVQPRFPVTPPVQPRFPLSFRLVPVPWLHVPVLRPGARPSADLLPFTVILDLHVALSHRDPLTVFNVYFSVVNFWLSSHIWLFRLVSSQLISQLIDACCRQHAW